MEQAVEYGITCEEVQILFIKKAICRAELIPKCCKAFTHGSSQLDLRAFFLGRGHVSLPPHLESLVDEALVEELLHDPPHALHEAGVHRAVALVKVDPAAKSVDSLLPLLGVPADDEGFGEWGRSDSLKGWAGN